MKKLLLFIVVGFIASGSYAQAIKRITKRIERKVENKVAEKIEKEIDKSVDGDKKPKTKTPEKASEKTSGKESEKNQAPENTGTEKTAGTNSATSSDKPDLQAFSRYDFIPGDKIIEQENFESDAVGDFPLRWNTDAAGEIVTLNELEGKWLRINKKGVFHPELIKSLPENFTLEFDVAVNKGFDYYNTNLAVYITDVEESGRLRWNSKSNVHFTLHPLDASMKNGASRVLVTNKSSHIVDNNTKLHQFHSKTKNIAHVAVWRQNQRLRVYVNEDKIWDLPRAFDPAQSYNTLLFSTGNFHKEPDYFVVGNLKLAAGAPDTRNKLLTEGKFVTRGILFDVNSDEIKPESYGVLKDIASVLSSNNDVKVKVVGHTDSDGDDKKNLDLSVKRAIAVKAALVKHFSIDASRIETDGKGD